MPEFTRMHLYDRVVPWKEYLVPLRQSLTGPMRLLEIGIFEGRAACWFLDNVLTGPADLYVGIDPWEIDVMDARRFPRNDEGEQKLRDVEARGRGNLAVYGSKAQIIKARSWDALHYQAPWLDRMAARTFHAAYIDGVHGLGPVALDTLNVWPLIEPGGIIIWDDYRRPKPKREPQIFQALEPFLDLVRDRIEVLWENMQLGIRKVR